MQEKAHKEYVSHIDKSLAELALKVDMILNTYFESFKADTRFKLSKKADV